MKLWKDDNELFDIARKELFTALVGDVLDKWDISTNSLLRRLNHFARIWLQ